MKSFIIGLLCLSFISSELIKEDLGNGIYYIGVNDDKITLFEGQYPVKQGKSACRQDDSHTILLWGKGSDLPPA